jgi:glycine hydroxymethyltransferase
MSPLFSTDPQAGALVLSEQKRQRETLTLIASENYASPAVLEAAGTVFTNKYADGVPGHRDYPGCGPSDEIEELARQRLCALFGPEHANVQPYCGSIANIAVFLATLRPGDTLLSMSVEDGGHPTHGSPENLSSRLYPAVRYGVDPASGLIDEAEIAALAKKERPKMLICGASSYPRRIDFRAFAEIAEETGALCLADIAHVAGLIAAGVYPSPGGRIPLITTTTHKTLRGPRGGAVLCDATYADAIDAAVYPGLQGGPLMHIIAAKAVCFAEAATAEFRGYADQVLTNATVLAKTLDGEGITLATGGTDTHLMVVDLKGIGISGEEAERALEAVGICADRCPFPGRNEDYVRTSGIRLGTPAATSRGMGDEEMRAIGHLVATVLRKSDVPTTLAEVKAEVAALACRFPITPDPCGAGREP